ncbi:hypothetical protein HU200_012944 [Digitaria exilis]|uniref:Uncharacterized protein n=1 Tax=Digitaria exilis TaxID=1010633 RepID=A0A835KK24_9POAL|nr:hypothetical protein HU200_012944 [Digitaria exilis]
MDDRAEQQSKSESVKKEGRKQGKKEKRTDSGSSSWAEGGSLLCFFLLPLYVEENKIDQMDPSVCRLHPGVAVTGFCPACLRDRLAGLQPPPPPSSADLRRCKSFSYARSAAAVEPQRRSCDLFRQPIVAAVREEEDYPQEQEASKRSFLGRKLQQWRRKNKANKQDPAPEMVSGAGRYNHHHRPSCDVPSSGGLAVPVPVPAMMLSSLSVEEDDDDNDMTMMPVPRSDGQIPVEEDYYYGDGYGYDNGVVVPGGSVQTRDYYLDSSSSSSRRRRSVDRASAISGRNSFSDAANIINNNNGGGEVPTTTNNNGGGIARVSPAVAERPLYHHHYHHEAQSVLVHHHHQYQIPASRPPTSNTTKTKGIRGWSIWGLISKKSSNKQRQPDNAGDHHVRRPSSFFSEQAAAGTGAEYPWPELRARGYDGQMLRCNSSISARSSFSGSGAAAMIGGRRSLSGVDFRDHHGSGGGGGLPPPERRRTTRRDEVLLERTRGRPSSKLQHEQRRSTLGLY